MTKRQNNEVNEVYEARALCDILEKDSIDEGLRDKSFKEIKELLEKSTESTNDIFTIIIYRLKAYEAKKYELLIVYLGKTSNYNIIKDFFWHFNDPKYVFHLLQNVYKVKWVRNSISIFEDSILHFWSVSRDATEIGRAHV